MGQVFISYHRSDASLQAHWLAGELQDRHGAGVYLDVDNVPLGADWRAAIRQAVLDADLVLLVMGSGWTPTEAVELEIDTAFSSGTPILPVLWDDTELPGLLRDASATVTRLGDINAARVRTQTFRSDVARIVGAFEGIGSAGPAPATSAPDSPSNDRVDVILLDPGEAKIQTIKEVRTLTALGLKEAKDLVDNPPRAVVENLPAADAELAASRLREAGATVAIEPHRERAAGGPTPQTDLMDVVLLTPGETKVQLIKEVRGITPLGLKEAKDLVESTPIVVVQSVTRPEGSRIVELLESAGGGAALMPHQDIE